MSLYEQIDREPTSTSIRTLEYCLIYALCFTLLLISAVIRRLGLLASGAKNGSGRSILGEARTSAANCAASSFMGL
jgi:hypothetical protein